MFQRMTENYLVKLVTFYALLDFYFFTILG